MRQITKEAIQAFMHNYSFKKSNTEVKQVNGITCLYLFNNLIAKRNPKHNYILICLQGWNSNTTRERLNGLPNVNISSKKNIPYLNGEEMGFYKWHAINI